MGGGMPIGAFISSKLIMTCLRENPILGHITTFGGHPVSAVASLAALEIILNERLYDQIPSKIALFKSNLNHPEIKEIREAGFMIAVEFENFSRLKRIIDKAIELGVITDWFLFCDNSMRIAPPLTISEDEIHEACEIILKAIVETTEEFN